MNQIYRCINIISLNDEEFLGLPKVWYRYLPHSEVKPKWTEQHSKIQ